MRKLTTILAAAALAVIPTISTYAQSTGASPADPNNERNQNPAQSNSEPADSAANDGPSQRVPTAQPDRTAADRQEGGANGERSAGSVIADPDGPAAVSPPPAAYGE
jgi:hypothetical protein